MHFWGWQDNPYAIMAAASAYVSTSDFEGFPNAVIEAQACGAPVLSTTCPYGPEEIITHGVDGLLCDMRNAPQLAALMSQLIVDQRGREAIAQKGAERVRRFDASVIVDKYAQVFDEAMAAI